MGAVIGPGPTTRALVNLPAVLLALLLLLSGIQATAETAKILMISLYKKAGKTSC